jgi:hypothetical protein
MQSHLDTLGWLHLLAGWVGVITGVSLIVLTLGAGSLLGDPATAGRVAAVMWLLGGAGLLLVTGGFVMMATGRGLVARRRGARWGALALALPNLCGLPFGTALAVYTLWALLNDDARQAFGRPLRADRAS